MIPPRLGDADAGRPMCYQGGVDVRIEVGETPVEPLLAPLAGAFDFARAEDALRSAAEALPAGWPVGLERALLARALPKLDLAPVPLRSAVARGMRFEDEGGAEHLLARPPSEVAAWRLWALLDGGAVSAADITELSVHMGGGGGVRSRPAAATRRPSGERIAFLAPDKVPGRLDSVLRRLAEPRPALSPLLHATGIYFDFLNIHPLPDGNGRMARLLFQGALKQTLGIGAPVAPLGPAVALYRGHVLQTYLAWRIDKDPKPLISFILSAVAGTAGSIRSIVAQTK